MILTQARIPYDIAARSWKDGGFRDSYAWHKRIWEAFPGKPEADRDFLTRLDDTGNDFRLLIISPESPERPDWCPSDTWNSKQIPDSFFAHTTYQFSLLANPTIKRVVRNEDGSRRKNGRREPIVDRNELLSWMQRKADQCGFTVDLDTLRTVPRPRQHFLKKGKKENPQTGTHTATEFQGFLKVTDQTAFQKAAITGIGSAKAFGFGMLCLSPIEK